MTARPLLAAGSTISSVLPDWFNVRDYGAIGDGVTDDGPAIQSAHNAAKVANGTVYFPAPYNYRVATDINASQSHSFRWTGSGSGGVGPTLEFENGATLKLHSSYLFEIDRLHFKGKTGKTGNVVDIDGIGALGTGADCQQFHVHDCDFEGDAGVAVTLLRINKAHTLQVDNCRFGGSQYSLKLGGTHFVNAANIGPTNIFNPSCTGAHIAVDGGGGHENVRVFHNTFEAGINTTAVKCINSGTFYKFEFSGNWLGDASSDQICLDGLVNVSNAHVSTIRDNIFELGGTVNCVGIKFGDPGGGNLMGHWLVDGNSFLGSGNAYDGYTGQPWGTINRYNNSYIALTNVFKSGGPTQQGVTLGNYGGEASILDIVTKTGAANPAVTTGQFQLGDVSSFSATQSGTGFEFGPAFSSTAALIGVDESRMRVQGGASNGEVRVQPNKVGFYGTGPVAQASRAGQLTDSTGGTVSGTLAAGITDSVAKNAIASLAAKVNALETIIHNLGLSA